MKKIVLILCFFYFDFSFSQNFYIRIPEKEGIPKIVSKSANKIALKKVIPG